MDFWKTLFEGIESLRANKLRSFLTILGIVIGVAAVIALLALGNGASDSILGEIEGIGTNVLFIRQSDDEEIRNPSYLTLADAAALADPILAPSVDQVAPYIQSKSEITFAGETTHTGLLGVTTDYAAVRSFEIAEGDNISLDQVNGRSAVAVLGPDTAIDLFGRSEGIVGETIRIEGQPFHVIGVLKSKGGSAFGSEDDQVLIPISTAHARLIHRKTNTQVDLILVSAIDSDSVGLAEQEVTEILRVRHRTEIGKDDFSIMSQQNFIDMAASITGVMTVFLGGIAGISLLVGGIGIMNIMLVSVIERTREIGLRKALGARKNDILLQFLSESALLSLIGGIIGILLGWLISVLVQVVTANTSTPFIPIITTDSILLATAFSTVVGIFFGWYPANRAANLEPVEALRTD